MNEKFDLEKMFERIYTEYGFDMNEVYAKHPILFKVTCYTIVSFFLDFMVNELGELSEIESIQAFQSMESQCNKFISDLL